MIACGGDTTPEQALRERVQAQSDAWLSGNIEEMFEFMSPRHRAVCPEAAFVEIYSGALPLVRSFFGVAPGESMEGETVRVIVDGQDFNAALVEQGYARVYTEGSSSREQKYLELKEQAQAGNVGLWACAGPATAAPSDGGLRYDQQGPDRDCGDFSTWQEAQAFYEAAGGPASDPHCLDGDKDGIPCESLPGAS